MEFNLPNLTHEVELEREKIQKRIKDISDKSLNDVSSPFENMENISLAIKETNKSLEKMSLIFEKQVSEIRTISESASKQAQKSDTLSHVSLVVSILAVIIELLALLCSILL